MRPIKEDMEILAEDYDPEPIRRWKTGLRLVGCASLLAVNRIVNYKMNMRRRNQRGGGGAVLLMLALVWIASSGCTLWPDTPLPGSQATRNPESQARAAAVVANSSAVFQPRDTSDLYFVFARRKAAGVDHPGRRGIANDPRHRLYAVLVNGGAEGYHQTNVLNAANALTQLGVDAKNIFILSTGVPWMNIAAYDPVVTPFRVIAKPTATNFNCV